MQYIVEAEYAGTKQIGRTVMDEISLLNVQLTKDLSDLSNA